MAAKAKRYPTVNEIRLLSLQELFDRRLIGLAPASYGTLDTR